MHLSESQRLPKVITLRPMGQQDMEFLRSLYASTSSNDLAPIAGPSEQIESLISMQFDAQHRHYQQHYPDARFSIIEEFCRPIGRIYVHSNEYALCLIDIRLVHERQGQGLGSLLLGELLIEARENGLVVDLHVDPLSPAYRLYSRLGFQELESNGIHCRMQWRPKN